MIGEDMKGATLQEVLKVLYSQVDRKEFSVKSTVPRLGRLQLLGEVRDGMPLSVDVLLENCSNGSVGGICHDVGRGPRLRVCEKGSLG